MTTAAIPARSTNKFRSHTGALPKGRVPFKKTKGYLFVNRIVTKIYEFQATTGLIRQTGLLILDIVLVVDKIFEKFPKTVGATAQIMVSCFSFLYISSSVADVIKCSYDVYYAMQHADMLGTVHTVVKLAVKITDFTLLFGNGFSAIIQLLGFSKANETLLSIMRPIGLVSFITSFTLNLLDYAINKRLVVKLVDATKEDKIKITVAFRRLMVNPNDKQAIANAPLLTLRIIRQLPPSTLSGLQQKMRAASQSDATPEELYEELMTKIMSAIEFRKLEVQSNFALTVLGYSCMAVNRFFKGTVVEKATETSICFIWWVKAATAYLETLYMKQ